MDSDTTYAIWCWSEHCAQSGRVYDVTNDHEQHDDFWDVHCWGTGTPLELAAQALGVLDTPAYKTSSYQRRCAMSVEEYLRRNYGLETETLEEVAEDDE